VRVFLELDALARRRATRLSTIRRSSSVVVLGVVVFAARFHDDEEDDEEPDDEDDDDDDDDDGENESDDDDDELLLLLLDDESSELTRTLLADDERSLLLVLVESSLLLELELESIVISLPDDELESDERDDDESDTVVPNVDAERHALSDVSDPGSHVHSGGTPPRHESMPTIVKPAKRAPRAVHGSTSYGDVHSVMMPQLSLSFARRYERPL